MRVGAPRPAAKGGRREPPPFARRCRRPMRARGLRRLRPSRSYSSVPSFDSPDDDDDDDRTRTPKRATAAPSRARHAGASTIAEVPKHFRTTSEVPRAPTRVRRRRVALASGGATLSSPEARASDGTASEARRTTARSTTLASFLSLYLRFGDVRTRLRRIRAARERAIPATRRSGARVRPSHSTTRPV